MANHKRRRPKSSRAGCMLCKPWKHQGRKKSVRHQRMQERRVQVSEREQRSD